MDVGILARATAIVPENQPGGTYRENGYTVIPVCVQKVEYKGDRKRASKMKRNISSLQEISVKGNLEVPRG